MKRFINNKRGSFSINTVIILGFMLPFFLFFYVEMNYFWTMKFKVESFTENIAAAAVMNFDEESLAEGIIRIDEDAATQSASDMLIASYNLNDDLSIKNDVMIKENPIMKVYTINDIPEEGMEFVTDEGYSFTVRKPSVIVYSEVKPKGILFSRDAVLKSISMQEAEFPIPQQLTTPNVSTQGNNVYMVINKIINPIMTNEFDGLKWEGNLIPVSGGTNMDVAVHIKNPSKVIDSALLKVTIIGPEYNYYDTYNMAPFENTASAEIAIPSDAPVGAEIYISSDIYTPKGLLTFPSSGGTQRFAVINNNIKEIVRIKESTERPMYIY